MEKWFVVAAVWSMCAMCAVLFIRGATGGAPRGERSRGRGGVRSGAAGGYEANDA
jgi:hypothetical protein